MSMSSFHIFVVLTFRLSEIIVLSIELLNWHTSLLAACCYHTDVDNPAVANLLVLGPEPAPWAAFSECDSNKHNTSTKSNKHPTNLTNNEIMEVLVFSVKIHCFFVRRFTSWPHICLMLIKNSNQTSGLHTLDFRYLGMQRQNANWQSSWINSFKGQEYECRVLQNNMLELKNKNFWVHENEVWTC
jgi:hypothetical protein